MRTIHRVLSVAFLFVLIAHTLAQEPTRLTPGQSLEATIAGGQTHTYRITLQAGQFVHFDVQQTSCDVALTLIAPDGAKRQVNATFYGFPETLSTEITSTGEYQLALRSVDFPKMTGTFRLQANVKSAADANDKKRLQAEQLLLEWRNNNVPEQRLEKARQMLAIWQELGERFWEGFAHYQIGGAFFALQNTPKATEQLQLSLSIWRALNLRIGETLALQSLAMCQQRYSQTDKAIATAQEAVKIAREINARTQIAALLGTLGDFHFSRTLWDQAREYYEQSNAVWIELGNTANEAEYNNFRGMIAQRQKNFAEAQSFFELALTKAQAANNKRFAAIIFKNLGELQRDQTEFEKANEYDEKSLALSREINDKQSQINLLSSIGQYFYGRAEYEKALGYYDQQLVIAQEMGNRLSMGNALRSKGMAAHQMKQYDKAQEWLEQSLAILRELKFMEPHTFSLRELGRLNLTRGQRAKADEYFNQALEVARTTGSRMQELTELARVGSAYHSYYLDETAMKIFESELALARELKDQAWELSALAMVGETYLNTSRSEQYLASLAERLSLSRKYGRKAEEVSTLSGFCFAYVNPLKKPEQGIPYCEQTLALARQNGFSSLEQDALVNLSRASMNMHQYEKATDYLQQSLLLARKQFDRIGIGQSLFLLSQLHGYLGQKEKAIESAEQSLATLKAFPRKLAIVYEVQNLLGNLYQENNQYEKAIAIHEEAINFIKGSDTKGYQFVAVQNLGYDYVKSGRYEKALELFDAAQKVIGNDPLSQPYEWYSYFGSGAARRELKDYQQAIQDHLRSLLLSQQYSYSRTETGQVLEQLMKDWKAINNPAVAIFYGKQAINSYQDTRYNIRNLEKDLQQSFLKSKEQTYRELADLLISQGRLPEAEQVIRMLKEEEFYEYIRRDNKNAPKSEKASLTPEEAALEKRYREIADKLTAIGTERSVLLDKKARTADEEKQLAKLEDDLGIAMQVFQKFLDTLSNELGKNKARDSQIYNVQQSQALMGDLRELGKGTAALYTLVGEEKFRVILTTSDVQKAYEYPIKAATLNRKVLDFRAALQNPKLDPLPLAQELYKIVVAPLAKDLDAAKAETLMWSLDGVLRYVPIAALHDGKQYLVERFRNVVFTNESKARLKDEVSKNWRALGLGVTKAHGQDSALPAVADEMRGIIREGDSKTGVLPGAIKLDEQFTLEAMRTSLRTRPSVVHVASHFQFKPATKPIRPCCSAMAIS